MITRYLPFGTRLAALFTVCLLSATANAAPKVVASIPPLASLVAGVMDGVATPLSLVPPGASLHNFSMRPSQAAALNQADVMFWVGDGFEAFLSKPVAALSDHVTIVALTDADGVVVRRGRTGGVWEHHDEGDHDDDHQHDDHGHDIDGHIWLDPNNAAAMVAVIADALTRIDHDNAAIYHTNANTLRRRIEALDANLKVRLAPIKSRPFVVFHDAYQYLELQYGLNAVGAITLSPDRLPGAQRISEIKAKIATLKAACVFAEPQFEPRLVQTLIEGTSAKVGVLDPEGSRLPESRSLYFELMSGLADDLIACLSD